MRISHIVAAGAALAISSSAMADGFVNGGFEAGNTTSWNVVSSTSRTSVLNPGLTPAFVKAGGTSGARSSIVTNSFVDPNVGSLLGGAVYSGTYSYRVEDTTSGGYASLIEQRVNNYTDANIFFAWKSVLEGAHGATDAATMIITLTDLTANNVVISRIYNAAAGGGGVAPGVFQSANGYFYTPQWQIEQLAIGPNLMGHDFLLSVIAADCQPSGHAGYVFLDGFGAVTPPPVDPGAVPEPATWAMMLAGFGMIGGAMRYRRRNTKVTFA